MCRRLAFFLIAAGERRARVDAQTRALEAAKDVNRATQAAQERNLAINEQSQ